MKYCPRCKRRRRLKFFDSNKSKSDGKQSYCQDCRSAQSKVDCRTPRFHRAQARYRENNRSRIGLTNKQYRDRNPGMNTEKSRRNRNLYRQKFRARVALWNAITRGKIKRRPCRTCGNPKAQAHHTDYSKPLKVDWLCTKHHGLQHRKYKY